MKLDLPMSDDWDRQSSRLRCLCQLHADLCGAVDTVNCAYGVQALVYILTIFLHLIISPYFFLLNLLYPKTYGKRDPAFLVLQALWIFIHLSKLFLIVHPWKVIEDQVTIKRNIIYLSNNYWFNWGLSSGTGGLLRFLSVSSVWHFFGEWNVVSLNSGFLDHEVRIIHGQIKN